MHIFLNMLPLTISICLQEKYGLKLSVVLNELDGIILNIEEQ